LTKQPTETIIPATRSGGGRHQIGTQAGFGSEQGAGFRLECMAGFIGIRIPPEDGMNEDIVKRMRRQLDAPASVMGGESHLKPGRRAGSRR
jgi:hypothetical protein